MDNPVYETQARSELVTFPAWPAGSAARQAVNCRQRDFRSWRPTNCLFAFGWCDVCRVIVYIPKATGNPSLFKFISTLLPGHQHSPTFSSGHSGSLYCWRHYKNRDSL